MGQHFNFVCSAAVCAEAYNPDDDEDDDAEPRVVHPKTDEQRRRLQDACRDILLFKTLEQVYAHILYDGWKEMVVFMIVVFYFRQCDSVLTCL